MRNRHQPRGNRTDQDGAVSAKQPMGPTDATPAARIDASPGPRSSAVARRRRRLTAPVVVIHEGVIFEGNCTIKPKDDSLSQAEPKLSTIADESAEALESSRKSNKSLGSAKIAK